MFICTLKFIKCVSLVKRWSNNIVDTPPPTFKSAHAYGLNIVQIIKDKIKVV